MNESKPIRGIDHPSPRSKPNPGQMHELEDMEPFLTGYPSGPSEGQTFTRDGVPHVYVGGEWRVDPLTALTEALESLHITGKLLVMYEADLAAAILAHPAMADLARKAAASPEDCDHKGIGKPGCWTCDPVRIQQRHEAAALEQDG